MKKVYICCAFIVYSFAVPLYAMSDQGSDFDEEFDRAQAEQDSADPKKNVTWLLMQIGSATISGAESVACYVGNISPHKDPEQQGIIDRALRKLHTVVGGKSVEAAKLGIKYPGIDDETFRAYADENATEGLIRAIDEDVPLSKQHIVTLSRRTHVAIELCVEVINTQSAEKLEELKIVSESLVIARQLLESRVCAKLIAPCMLGAVRRKAEVLKSDFAKLVALIQPKNSSAGEQELVEESKIVEL